MKQRKQAKHFWKACLYNILLRLAIKKDKLKKKGENGKQMDRKKGIEKNKKEAKQDAEFGSELGDPNAAKIYDILQGSKKRQKGGSC